MKRIISSTFFIFLLSMFFNQVTFAEEIVKSGVPIDGKIESSDENDVYQITTSKDGEVYITLDNTTGGFLLYLYDANGYEVGYDYASKGNSSVIFQNVAKGNYSVKISPYDWDGITNATYRLKVTYSSSIKRDGKTFEPNDTNETSMPIDSGKIYKSNSFSKNDRDVYQIKTNKDGEVYITLDNTTGGYIMYLYDTNGKEVSYDYASKGGSSVIYESVPKGTYYIKVIPYDWSGITNATYRLKATYPSSIKRDSKTFESNDTNETSMSIISNQYYSSNSFSSVDRDVYQIKTNKDGEVYITLDKTTGGYIIYLYDTNGREVSYDYASKGDSSVISTSVAKGTYYVKVIPYNWRGITNATYRLKAVYKDKTPSVNAITHKSRVITGKAETNATVYAMVGKKQIGKAKANKGAFSMKINKQKAGTSVSVYIVDKAGVKSGSKTVKVTKGK